MPAEIVVLNNIVKGGWRVERPRDSNGVATGDAAIVIEYLTHDNKRETTRNKTVRPPLNATRQAQLNMIDDLVTAYVDSLEA